MTKSRLYRILSKYPIGKLQVLVSARDASKSYRRLVVGINQESRAAGGWTVETTSPDDLMNSSMEELILALSNTNHSITETKPYLRSFDALLTPIDGEIPALVVAKLAQGRFTNRLATWGEPELLADRIRIEYRMPRTIVPLVIMWEDWSVAVLGDGEYACNQSAIIDYLRDNLFALPVDGQTLIVDKDYLELD